MCEFTVLRMQRVGCESFYKAAQVWNVIYFLGCFSVHAHLSAVLVQPDELEGKIALHMPPIGIGRKRLAVTED